jgi:CheY-like chemotaxis protein
LLREQHSIDTYVLDVRKLGLKLAGGHVIHLDPSAKKVILCIDDDPSILRYETALFERHGYTVLTAASGQEGLWLVATSHCDAVVLDYEMPWMNGHDVAFELKLRRPDPVIILLSGSDVPTRALALVDAFVLKLEASKQLLPMIAELCSRSLDTRRRQEGV